MVQRIESALHVVGGESPLDPMKVSKLGEDAVVAALIRALPLGPDVRHGAGDDCAVLGGKRDRWWRLLKTDCVIETVHFLPSENAARVGWKALCRAISDIAAMGGIPEHAVITLAVRPEIEMAWMRDLYDGLKKAARKFGVSIVGGETSRSPGPTFISVALTGRVERASSASFFIFLFPSSLLLPPAYPLN